MWRFHSALRQKSWGMTPLPSHRHVPHGLMKHCANSFSGKEKRQPQICPFPRRRRQPRGHREQRGECFAMHRSRPTRYPAVRESPRSDRQSAPWTGRPPARAPRAGRNLRPRSSWFARQFVRAERQVRRMLEDKEFQCPKRRQGQPRRERDDPHQTTVENVSRCDSVAHGLLRHSGYDKKHP